ncbi:MAG: hypothetical protein CMJ65_08960 [Planctomycetaceae bacterium]|jgi:lipoprotein NlpI|nr:hypothetical protein [Planctomycetaceae bacterium]MDP7275977.1 tetratricopeptide repeat protein [Planctomycetaceae bacterium]
MRLPVATLSILSLLTLGPTASRGADAPPLSSETRKTIKTMKETWEKQVKQLTSQIKDQPDRVGFYSRRADALFYLGRFDAAVTDYEKMVELDKKLDAPHWRRGIAWFYAGTFKKAAHQFEIYNSFDDVDRENGIWRFFSQARAYGLARARQGLLKYKKDDREPFPSVYRLFAGKTTPEKILASITSAKIDKTEREKRLFYAQLYIGLDHAIHDRDQKALAHLREAVANTWGPRSGFGPHYMWQVGRLHYELLAAKAKKKAEKPKPGKSS